MYLALLILSFIYITLKAISLSPKIALEVELYGGQQLVAWALGYIAAILLLWALGSALLYAVLLFINALS